MRRWLWLLIVGVCLNSGLSAAQITISDNADTITQKSVKSLTIVWPAFVASDGAYVAAGSQSVELKEKTLTSEKNDFTVSLPSNAGTGIPYTWNFVINLPQNKTSLLSARVTLPEAISPATFAQCQVMAPWYAGSITIPPIPPTNPGTGNSSGGNATSVLNIPYNLTPPTSGQGWIYNFATNSLEPVAIPYWKKFSITFSQLTSFNSTTGTITIAARAARQKVCGASFFITSGFVGAGISRITASLGDSNGSADQYTPVPASLADNANFDYSVMAGAPGASSIQATVNTTGANLSALTAGAVDVDICLVQLP